MDKHIWKKTGDTRGKPFILLKIVHLHIVLQMIK